MKEKTRDLIKEYMRSHSRRRQVLIALASIVVFVTTYALVLPALTLDKDEAASQGGIGVQTSGQTADVKEEADANPAADENNADADNKAEEAAEESSESDKEKSDKEAASDTISKESAEKQDAKEKHTSGEPLTYEDKKIKVTATPHDTEIPDGAVLEVTEITSDMKAYAAYFKALNRGFKDDPYDGDNSLLYDVSIMVDGAEYEPESGEIEIKIDFKDNQLSEILGSELDENASLRVIHLPIKDADQADAFKNVKASQIERDYVSEITVDKEDSESVSFALESLSVITVTGASTDVTITGSLTGTDLTGLRYDLYVYLNPTNGGKVYGGKLEFVDGNAVVNIPQVPVGEYKLALVYPNITYLDGGKVKEQEKLNYPVAENNQVFDDHRTTWVDEDGGFVFGFSAGLPEDKTISESDNTLSFTLGTTDVQSSLSIKNLMDRALNYGVTADKVILPNNCYTNFATKELDIANQNTQTYYGHRSDGIDVVPNIAASVNNNGQPLTTEENQAANYYVTDKDKDKVNSTNKEETIVRNKNELEDRVEIMLSNTLKQAEELKDMSMMTLQSCTSVDLSPYGDDETIILDATAISGERNGFTIVKRPGQTVIFNINGQGVAPPDNIKILEVDKNGQTLGYYKAGNDMKNASADVGKVWSKVVWNFPDATSVTANNPVGGIFLLPHGSFTANDKGGGWIVARNQATVTNEWYGFPGSDEPFKKKIIRKTFIGIDESKVQSDYALKLWTHTNESTSGTTQDQLITTLVRKNKDDSTLVSDPSGLNDETPYLNDGHDEEGNYYIEWETPPLSVGNEHKLTEINSTSTAGDKVVLVEFKAPFSEWSTEARDYVWIQRNLRYGSEEEFAGIFNVSAHNEDYRRSAYVTNYYEVDQTTHDLTLNKKVVDSNDLEPQNQSYSFDVTFTTQDDNPFTGTVTYQIDEEAEKSVSVTDGKLSLSLKDGQKAVFKQLPFGTKYSIEEKNLPEKCAVAFTGDTTGLPKGTGTIVTDREVTARNTYYDGPGRGSLTVSKTVNDNTKDKEAAPTTFSFTIKNANGHYVNRLGEETSESSEYTFTINGGESVKFTGWAAGRYTIEEVRESAAPVKEDVRWALTIGGDANSSGRFAIEENGETSVSLTNTYEDIGKGTLNVTKTVVDNTESHAVPTSFEFTLKNSAGKYMKKNSNGSYTESDNEQDGTYTITNGATVEFARLPEDTYTVTEKDASSTSDDITWTVTGGGNATVTKNETTNVTLTNTYEDEPEYTGNGTIKIKKNVSGGGSAASSKKYYVTVKVEIKGATRYLQNLSGKIGKNAVQMEIDPNKQYTIENLPDGTYTVTENTERAQINGYTLNTTGNAESKTLIWDQYWYSVPDFNITNKYEEIKQDTDKAQITVEKKWYENGEDITDTTDEDSATVQLVRYKTEKTSVTLHFPTIADKEDIEIPSNAKLTVIASDFSQMGLSNVGGLTESWQVSQNLIAGDTGWAHYKTFDYQLDGNYSDIYFYNFTDGRTFTFEYSPSTIPTSGDPVREDMSDALTLTKDNDWQWTFYNLPLSGNEGGKNYKYSYVIEETDPITGYTTTYKVNDGSFKTSLTADDAINSTTPGTITVKNSKETSDEKTNIQLQKIDGNDNSPLSGSKFALYYCSTQDGTYTIVTELEDITLDSNNWFEVPENGITIQNLGKGFYKITEEVSPGGYVVTEKTPVAFEVNEDGTITNNSIAAVTYDATDKSFKVPNTAGEELPMTGGSGTGIYYLLGGLLAVASVVSILLRKRALRQAAAKDRR